MFRKKPTQNKLGKLPSLCEDGVHLGIRMVSGEQFAGTAEGVWRTRTIQRKTPSERWSSVVADIVGEVPWHTSEQDPGADGPPVHVTLGERMSDGVRAHRDLPRGSPRKSADHAARRGAVRLHRGVPGMLGRGVGEGTTRARGGVQDAYRARDRGGRKCRGNTPVEKVLDAEDRKRRLAERNTRCRLSSACKGTVNMICI